MVSLAELKTASCGQLIVPERRGRTEASFGPPVARSLLNATAVTVPSIAHVAFASPSPQANACTQQIVRSLFGVPGKAKTGCIAKVPPTDFETTKR